MVGAPTHRSRVCQFEDVSILERPIHGAAVAALAIYLQSHDPPLLRPP
jgi:hypothetical protein